MNPSRAANGALGLIAAGWLLAIYGVLSQLGDPAPWVTHAELETHRHISVALMFSGGLTLICGIWLSGYSFPSAPRRASIALAGCLLPLAVFFALAMG